MIIGISIGLFLAIILLVQGGYYFYYQHLNPQSKTLKRRLRGTSRKLDDDVKGNESADILRQRKLSDVHWLNQILTSASSLKGLEKKLQQANNQMPLSVFFLL